MLGIQQESLMERADSTADGGLRPRSVARSVQFAGGGMRQARSGVAQDGIRFAGPAARIWWENCRGSQSRRRHSIKAVLPHPDIQLMPRQAERLGSL